MTQSSEVEAQKLPPGSTLLHSHFNPKGAQVSRKFTYLSITLVCLGVFAFIGVNPGRSASTEAPQPGQKPVPIADQSRTLQPIVGYAVTTTCVVPDQPMEVVFHLESYSKMPLTIVVRPAWIAAIGETAQKGPSLPVDTTRSGLIQSERLPAWHWAVSLKAGAMINLRMYIVRAPTPYFPPLPWQFKYAPRMYISATANVRHTSIELNLDAKPTFCQAK